MLYFQWWQLHQTFCWKKKRARQFLLGNIWCWGSNYKFENFVQAHCQFSIIHVLFCFFKLGRDKNKFWKCLFPTCGDTTGHEQLDRLSWWDSIATISYSLSNPWVCHQYVKWDSPDEVSAMSDKSSSCWKYIIPMNYWLLPYECLMRAAHLI